MNKMTAWLQGWLVTKGSDLSGNYGHKGRKGKRGGSLPGGGHSVVGISPDWPRDQAKNKLAWYRRHQEEARKKAKEEAAKRRAQAKMPKTMVGKPGTAPTDYDFEDIAPTDQRGKAYLSEGLGMSHFKFAIGDKYTGYLDTVSTVLANKAGLSSTDVRSTVGTWASTSNDTNMRALSMQAAISKELGVPMSDWQKQHMQDAIKKYPDLKDHMKARQKPLLDAQQSEHLVRTMYDSTQADLARVGFKPGDTIRMYRGIKHAEGIKKGEVVDLEQNAASSWSITPTIAWHFAGSKAGGVLAMDVPIESVLSTVKTGFGVMTESEFVVLGVPGAQALVVDTKG